jgi:immunoglobulin-like protein involved in spore germination/sporulation and spore germination protein
MGKRVGAALVATVAAVLVAGCTDAAVGTDVPVAPSSAPAAPATSPAADPADRQRALPLYYVTDTPAGPRLAREFRRLTVDDDPGSAALTALFSAPAGTVPGHRSLWPDGSGLASPVRHGGGVVTVDLTPRTAATAPADPLIAVQQLVYTVTGALGTTDPVRLLVDGAQVPRLWNDGVDTIDPVPRADPLGTRLLVGIDEPAEGATTSSPLRVAGEAAVFEATLRWEVRRGGELVRSGSASTAEGQRFSPYSFSVDLPPGDYEVRVAEDDPSDGAGRPAMTDTRRVTVTG